MSHVPKAWPTPSFRFNLEPFHRSSADGGQRQPQGFHRKLAGIERNCLYPSFLLKEKKKETLMSSVAFVQMFVLEASR